MSDNRPLSREASEERMASGERIRRSESKGSEGGLVGDSLSPNRVSGAAG